MTALDPWREPPMGLDAYCVRCKTYRTQTVNGVVICPICGTDPKPDRDPLPDVPGDRRATFGEGSC